MIKQWLQYMVNFVPHDTMTVKEYNYHCDVNRKNELLKTVEENGLKSLTKTQLLELAKLSNIKVNASMNKASIIKAIDLYEE